MFHGSSSSCIGMREALVWQDSEKARLYKISSEDTQGLVRHEREYMTLTWGEDPLDRPKVQNAQWHLRYTRWNAQEASMQVES